MKVEIELLRLLVEIGFLAESRGMLFEAETIFEGVSKYRPNSAYPLIGKASVIMNKGEFKEAISILSNAPYQDNKEKELRDSYLGKALKLAGYNNEANNVLKNVKENGTYDMAVNYANALLENDLIT
jgi:predicted Zn-dependent protease